MFVKKKALIYRNFSNNDYLKMLTNIFNNDITRIVYLLYVPNHGSMDLMAYVELS